MPATDRASRPDSDNPEWTEAMAVAAVRLEALPEGLQRKLRGRPRAAVTKQRTTLRLSRERPSGAFWSGASGSASVLASGQEPAT